MLVYFRLFFPKGQNRTSLRAPDPEFKSHSSLRSGAWPWAGSLTARCLSFLICNPGLRSRSLAWSPRGTARAYSWLHQDPTGARRALGASSRFPTPLPGSRADGVDERPTPRPTELRRLQSRKGGRACGGSEAEVLGTQRLGRGRLHAIARGFAVSPAAQVSSGRKRPGCSGSPGDESGGRPNPWRRLAALTQAPARWGGEAGKKAKGTTTPQAARRAPSQPGWGAHTHLKLRQPPSAQQRRRRRRELGGEGCAATQARWGRQAAHAHCACPAGELWRRWLSWRHLRRTVIFLSLFVVLASLG